MEKKDKIKELEIAIIKIKNEIKSENLSSGERRHKQNFIDWLTLEKNRIAGV